MNTYLKYQPSLIHFAAFLSLAAGFMLINALLMQYLFSDITALMQSKSGTIKPGMVMQFKVAQLMSALLSFMMPAALFAYFSDPKPFSYVGLRNQLFPALVLASFAILVVVQPFVGWLGQLNANINFGAMQQSLEKLEEQYNWALQTFLKMDGPGDLLLNLFIMAIVPAVGEELFFRGGLQTVLLRLTQKAWIAIVLSAVVFALLHGTFFKILPIFTLGLMIGIVYHVTRNLWYTIIIHFLNNGLAVLAVYFSQKNATVKRLVDNEMNIQWYVALISLVFTVGLLFFIYRNGKTAAAEYIKSDNDYIA